MMAMPELLGVVDRVLKERLSKDGYEEPSVFIEQDFDGEEIIRVTAHLAKPVENTDELYDCVAAIRRELAKSGDDRFVFLNQAYPGDDDFDDEDEDVAPLGGTH